jgi:hypothetical protein
VKSLLAPPACPPCRPVSLRRLLAACAAGVMLAATPLVAGASPLGSHEDQVGNDDGLSRPDFYRYLEQAFPNAWIAPAQTAGARRSFEAIAHQSGAATAWKQLSYEVGGVPALVTYTNRGFTAAGRVTALALTPGCGSGAGACQVFLGAAGGGVWVASNPFSNPLWSPAYAGLKSNAIGSLAVDPNGAGQILYAGTGEQNSSGDSEAGVGLFKSTDGGKSWQVIPASVPLAEGLSISAVIVDQRDSNHILFSTMTALHGLSASGNSYVPPGVTPPGIYESHDGGNSFSQLYNTLNNVFTGGIVQMALDPHDPDTIYASAFNTGIIRSSTRLDGDRVFRLIYTHRPARPGAPNDHFNRQAFALALLGKHTRIYVGDSNDADQTSYIARLDNADVPAGQLGDKSFQVLSSPTPGTPGYSSWGFCEGQCWYDMYLASPPGQPDVVWFGGSMNYNEIFTSKPPSNGRAVMRSTDAGVSFTDMTRDNRTPPGGMHPDQHALVFNPKNPNQVLAGSDGGMVLTSGKFVDASAQCASRGLSPTDLADCQAWLKAIPAYVVPENTNLQTLQYQGVVYNPSAPDTDWQGGTQDNGTWQGRAGNLVQLESIGGDGGNGGIDAVLPNQRFHTYYGPQVDVNFRSGAVPAWDWVADPLRNSGEGSEFYIPALSDPLVSGTIFAGLQHVWRTQDEGGAPAYLDQHCNEYTGDFSVTCGDFVPVGDDLTSTSFGKSRAGGVVSLLSRSTTNSDTLWAATNAGRLFVSQNASTAAANVKFRRIDDATTPPRVITGIAIDPLDGTHAFVSYTGYNAYSPKTPGHVFEVHAAPGSKPVFTDISSNIGDLPVTGLVQDPVNGDLYAATDFGVITRKGGKTAWVAAGSGFPDVAVYQLRLTQDGLVYAATHGRGIWTLKTR